MTVTKKSHFFLVLSPKVHFKKENKCKQNQKKKKKEKLHKVYHSKESHRKNCSRDLIEQINRFAKKKHQSILLWHIGVFLSPWHFSKEKVSKIGLPFSILFYSFSNIYGNFPRIVHNGKIALTRENGLNLLFLLNIMTSGDFPGYFEFLCVKMYEKR